MNLALVIGFCPGYEPSRGSPSSLSIIPSPNPSLFLTVKLPRVPEQQPAELRPRHELPAGSVHVDAPDGAVGVLQGDTVAGLGVPVPAREKGGGLEGRHEHRVDKKGDNIYIYFYYRV